MRAVEPVFPGVSPEKVVASLGFRHSCTYAWPAQYRCGGEAALAAKPIAGSSRAFPERYA